MRRLLAVGMLAVATALAAPARALEFRSITEQAAVLYDGPSKDSAKVLILTRDYPVEVVITTGGWVRVRDDNGAFAWIEEKNLSTRRTVMAKGEVVEARDAPTDSAPVVFRAEQGVVLEFLGISGGWARVRHRDGAAGFMKLSQLWGV